MNSARMLRNVGKNGRRKKKPIFIDSIVDLSSKFSCDLEVAYAKGLRKSSETFQKLAARTKG